MPIFYFLVRKVCLTVCFCPDCPYPLIFTNFGFFSQIICCCLTFAVFCLITSSLLADYVRKLNEAKWFCEAIKDSSCGYLEASTVSIRISFCTRILSLSACLPLCKTTFSSPSSTHLWWVGCYFFSKPS